MRKLTTICLLSALITSPAIVIDLTSEWSCLKKQYPKLEKDWYLCIVEECHNYNSKSKYTIEPSDICAFIQLESEWHSQVIHKNYKKGIVVSTDWGLCQLNSCHAADMTIYLNPITNLKKGIYEYHLCVEQGKGDKQTANRLYNAGRGNLPENYTNWPYVVAINASREKTKNIKESFFSVY